ncbi:MAG: AAA family ATPase, partial [Clostridia bacterium]|nr:AAA family ATPase [Clostridia bacterium]
KLTIIQGDPGEGKTTFALRLAAACSTGTAMPGMESLSPFNVIYQSAEDGLEDTPRALPTGATSSTRRS